MYALSEHAMITIWERGLHQHPVERALTILEIALPELSRSALLALSVGQRDAHLLAIREHTFGSRFAGFAQCQRCHESLEWKFQAASIRIGSASMESAVREHTLLIDGYEIRARLPNSADLRALLPCHTVEQARNVLIQHCIQYVQHGDDVLASAALSEQVFAALGQQIVERDPQAEIMFDLRCLACQYAWSALFDIVTFLWHEIRTHVNRLLHDVHVLANAYGWREADILTMSAVRRAFYLEMVSS